MRCRRPVILASFIVVAAFPLLAGGCGSGGSPGVARIASSTTAATTTTAAATTVTTEDGAIAFARCMRHHGIPNWPDPIADGRFDKAKLRQLGLSLSRVRAIEDSSCNYVFDIGGRPQPTITPADKVDYLKGAACMRSHGFPDFPDPTFQDDNVTIDVPSSIDTRSSQFRRAASICQKLIPKGLPYSGSSGS